MPQAEVTDVDVDLRDLEPPLRSDGRPARLAELVSELTGCPTGGARHAVGSVSDAPDPLEVVARAMMVVDRPVPDGFRVTGFLRNDLVPLTTHTAGASRLPRRVLGGLPRRAQLS